MASIQRRNKTGENRTVNLTSRSLAFIGFLLLPLSAFATTWYVRPDGGTRYSAKMPNGQCDGKSDAAFSGKGTNGHCAFKDVRYLWQDGSYTTDASQASFPAYGWVGAGGDTYLLRGSIHTGNAYRVGWNNGKTAYDERTAQFWGVQGNPYGSGAPPPLSGTPAQHTRILGENYASCHEASAKTQLAGGFGVSVVLSMSGSSYVDVACLDITDHSSCGKATQRSDCNAGGVMQDYANNAIQWSNTSTHDVLTDIHIHGMASAGMIGPTGDGVEMHYLDLLGNPSSGWNADANDGKTGTGSLLVQNYNISWNGCAEEYPVVHSVPYGDCTDQNSGGYGDGFGTATVLSNPGWSARFDQGVVSYNTQDGLDALHLIGNGSSMTVTRTLAYGNMGQQIKVGGASGTATNNLIVGNCTALRQPIPGTPPSFNAKLSLFCRAGDGATLLTVGPDTLLTFTHNTIYTAGAVAVEIECDNLKGPCDSTSRIDFTNNIMVGFRNDEAHGYPGGTEQYPTPIYNGTQADPFANKGSLYTNNVTFHPRSNWRCPAPHEKQALCADPQLADKTWHLYGYGNMAPASASSVVVGSGAPGNTNEDYAGKPRPATPSRGALEPGSEMPIAQSRVETGVQETIAYPGFGAKTEDAVLTTHHLHVALKYFGACAVAVAVWEGIRSMRGRAEKA